MPPDSLAVSGSGFWDWTARIGAITSILGIFLTGWVIYGVKQIRDHYLVRARVPDLVDQLSEYASEISSLVRDLPDTNHEVDVAAAECDGVLKNLKSKVPRQLKKSIKSVRAQIKKCRGDDNPAAEVRVVYAELQKLLVELRTHLEDLHWER